MCTAVIRHKENRRKPCREHMPVYIRATPADHLPEVIVECGGVGWQATEKGYIL